jgi:hypothetical protein
MNLFKKVLKIIRIIIASPFVLIGAAFYKVAELISGEIYARHANTVERNTIFKHKMHQYELSRPKGSNRTPAKKKRK